MNAASPLSEFADNKPRERQPYRLGAVIQSMREDAREMDAHLEKAITAMYVALEDDRVDEKEAFDILRDLMFAFKANSSQLNALNLLDESGSEPALREVERKNAIRKGAVK